ncbi:glycosyltransferase [Streptomyces sp. Ac-502]|uniref:glycosyltransferase n=1 Tax=Streptomyces sp. Ac-502 TaxID=3342801 RepID=UPI00386295F3
MKLFEYMSHVKAIIPSDLPVLRKVLMAGVNCLLCPPDDVAAWTAAVQLLADAPGGRASTKPEQVKANAAAGEWIPTTREVREVLELL